VTDSAIFFVTFVFGNDKDIKASKNFNREWFFLAEQFKHWFTSFVGLCVCNTIL